MRKSLTRKEKMLPVAVRTLSTVFLFVTICAGSSATEAAIAPKKYNNLPVIILKIDDLKNYKIAKFANEEVAWDRFLGFIQSKGLKANLGAIGEYFDSSSSVANAFHNDLKDDILASGVVELFNHSMCYCPDAFESSSNYNQQYSVLNKAQSVTSDAVGVTMVGFGSGGNKKSADTIRVMNNHPDMKVWFFGRDEINGVKLDKNKVLNLTRELPYSDIDKIGSVSVFLSNFENVKSKPFMVYQGHAGKWSDSQFDLFKRAMNALIEKYPKLKFMTISEYYRYSGGDGQVADAVRPLTTPSNLQLFRPSPK